MGLMSPLYCLGGMSHAYAAWFVAKQACLVLGLSKLAFLSDH